MQKCKGEFGSTSFGRLQPTEKSDHELMPLRTPKLEVRRLECDSFACKMAKRGFLEDLVDCIYVSGFYNALLTRL
jgi:hypothetical protein